MTSRKQKTMVSSELPAGLIEGKIHTIRGTRVMLAADLAKLYAVFDLFVHGQIK